MVKVKICGITNVKDALLCSEAGADALGFIFTKKSPRCITAPQARKIIGELDPFVAKVGVFLDDDKRKVLDTAASLGLDVLQFHGSETAAYCEFFRPKFKVVKVFFPQESLPLKKVAAFGVDALLLDVRYENKCRGARTLPAPALAQAAAFINKGYRVVISAGLNAGNVSSVIKLKPYAVDAASGVEKAVGKKDINLVRRFIKKVKGDKS